MGALNLTSFGLLIGALGQYWFFGRLFPWLPRWTVWGPLLVPWLAVYTISFCKRPPFGPRPFRWCLLIAAGWYAVFTVAAEVVQFSIRLPPDAHFPLAAARVLMYSGSLSLIVLVRAGIRLRRYESRKAATASPAPRSRP